MDLSFGCLEERPCTSHPGTRIPSKVGSSSSVVRGSSVQIQRRDPQNPKVKCRLQIKIPRTRKLNADFKSRLAFCKKIGLLVDPPSLRGEKLCQREKSPWPKPTLERMEKGVQGKKKKCLGKRKKGKKRIRKAKKKTKSEKRKRNAKKAKRATGGSPKESFFFEVKNFWKRV